MTISYPRIMPVDAWASQAFEIDRVDYGSAEAGGRLASVAAGFPLWVGDWTLTKSGKTKAEEVRAWISSLRGAGRQFYGRDHRRPYPLSTPNGFTGLTRAGGGSFDGTATSWSIDGTGEVLTLNGLPASFVFNLGDYVGFKWTTTSLPRRSLVRCIEAVVANGSGVATFTVAPPLPTLTPGSATATLDKPDCLMRSDPKQTTIGSMDRLGVVTARLAACQDLLA